ncbi:MAG: DUF4149 domain-containing protein [Helicobacter sp.]|nr:DUF4149 domain-containing protein [Helicobacteraceae bacterium]MDY3113092.1 DUF4149 domain-containing protein [Helicobacter sp.]
MQGLFKFQKYFFALYLLLIGTALGAIITSGAFSAPVIFRASAIVPTLEISPFESGLLMSEIFKKLNVILNFLAIYMLVYEILSMRVFGSKLAPLLGFISIILIGLFTLYYTPFMLNAQSLGETHTQNAAFDSMHLQSVYVFKALMVTLCALFIVRILKYKS